MTGGKRKRARLKPPFLYLFQLLTLCPASCIILTMNEIDILHNSTSNWIENLALEELNMDESGVVNFYSHVNMAHYLEESSIDFVNSLRDKFELYSEKFNEYRGGKDGSAKIKIFKISGTVNDFMLFRNSLRLIIARKANDLISIAFLLSNGQYFAENKNAPCEIKAHVGPFNEISWRYQGEIVEINSLVKHYLSEFIRKSAR